MTLFEINKSNELDAYGNDLLLPFCILTFFYPNRYNYTHYWYKKQIQVVMLPIFEYHSMLFGNKPLFVVFYLLFSPYAPTHQTNHFQMIPRHSARKSNCMTDSLQLQSRLFTTSTRMQQSTCSSVY